MMMWHWMWTHDLLAYTPWSLTRCVVKWIGTVAGALAFLSLPAIALMAMYGMAQ